MKNRTRITLCIITTFIVFCSWGMTAWAYLYFGFLAFAPCVLLSALTTGHWYSFIRKSEYDVEREGEK